MHINSLKKYTGMSKTVVKYNLNHVKCLKKNHNIDLSLLRYSYRKKYVIEHSKVQGQDSVIF